MLTLSRSVAAVAAVAAVALGIGFRGVAPTIAGWWKIPFCNWGQKDPNIGSVIYMLNIYSQKSQKILKANFCCPENSNKQEHFASVRRLILYETNTLFLYKPYVFAFLANFSYEMIWPGSLAGLPSCPAGGNRKGQWKIPIHGQRVFPHLGEKVDQHHSFLSISACWQKAKTKTEPAILTN